MADTFHEKDPAVIRNFLRSRWGRHLADELTLSADHRNEAALATAIPTTLARRTDKGFLAWEREFKEIRQATKRGEWQD